MTQKINIKSRITYTDWRALQPIQRTFAIGDVGEYMWGLHCKKSGAIHIRQTDYQVEGYDIVRMNSIGQYLSSEVKTMKYPYNGTGWDKYFFETNNKAKTKRPQYMTCDVDEYIIFDMLENKLHVYDCKVLAAALYVIDSDDYDSRWGWMPIEINSQGTAYGLWAYGTNKYASFLGYKYSVDAGPMPESFSWVAQYAKMDSEGRLQ